MTTPLHTIGPIAAARLAWASERRITHSYTFPVQGHSRAALVALTVSATALTQRTVIANHRRTAYAVLPTTLRPVDAPAKAVRIMHTSALATTVAAVLIGLLAVGTAHPTISLVAAVATLAVVGGLLSRLVPYHREQLRRRMTAKLLLPGDIAWIGELNGIGSTSPGDGRAFIEQLKLLLDSGQGIWSTTSAGLATYYRNAGITVTPLDNPDAVLVSFHR